MRLALIVLAAAGLAQAVYRSRCVKYAFCQVVCNSPPRSEFTYHVEASSVPSLALVKFYKIDLRDGGRRLRCSVRTDFAIETQVCTTEEDPRDRTGNTFSVEHDDIMPLDVLDSPFMATFEACCKVTRQTAHSLYLKAMTIADQWRFIARSSRVRVTCQAPPGDGPVQSICRSSFPEKFEAPCMVLTGTPPGSEFTYHVEASSLPSLALIRFIKKQNEDGRTRMYCSIRPEIGFKEQECKVEVDPADQSGGSYIVSHFDEIPIDVIDSQYTATFESCCKVLRRTTHQLDAYNEQMDNQWRLRLEAPIAQVVCDVPKGAGAVQSICRSSFPTRIAAPCRIHYGTCKVDYALTFGAFCKERNDSIEPGSHPGSFQSPPGSEFTYHVEASSPANLAFIKFYDKDYPDGRTNLFCSVKTELGFKEQTCAVVPNAADQTGRTFTLDHTEEIPLDVIDSQYTATFEACCNVFIKTTHRVEPLARLKIEQWTLLTHAPTAEVICDMPKGAGAVQSICRSSFPTRLSAPCLVEYNTCRTCATSTPSEVSQQRVAMSSGPSPARLSHVALCSLPERCLPAMRPTLLILTIACYVQAQTRVKCVGYSDCEVVCYSPPGAEFDYAVRATMPATLVGIRFYNLVESDGYRELRCAAKSAPGFEEQFCMTADSMTQPGEIFIVEHGGELRVEDLITPYKGWRNIFSTVTALMSRQQHSKRAAGSFGVLHIDST
ncbi:uncharacterized protein L969DRAFT_625620 [Mixia osmundae IAM 14324]|uniref:ZP domain-containing protein n=1 Tax=Mixia osmundae (strain CBS 9802 / IAM 14324 / JCM 22182 / KY 12970) TaxID=764103 RepID=G7E6R9_MIXOS|nr:uncharacterized protein L969DRAFT_625620 [Mixia osmundae IAM 14324]KEI39090.1 hypothetical protein L969DRAFT_625620 [Mixia osmundae IAM 14324]GAA98529.1 hypothetical protein E5Q_05216 [Mixia osmundae IAM 14324]